MRQQRPLSNVIRRMPVRIAKFTTRIVVQQTYHFTMALPYRPGQCPDRHRRLQREAVSLSGVVFQLLEHRHLLRRLRPPRPEQKRSRRS